MAAGATPTIYDPKVLARVISMGTGAATTIYQAPTIEAGVMVQGIVVSNKTGISCTLSLGQTDVGGTVANLMTTYTCLPTNTFNVCDITGPITLNGGGTADILNGQASIGTCLDISVYGVEMKD